MRHGRWLRHQAKHQNLADNLNLTDRVATFDTNQRCDQTQLVYTNIIFRQNTHICAKEDRAQFTNSVKVVIAGCIRRRQHWLKSFPLHVPIETSSRTIDLHFIIIVCFT